MPAQIELLAVLVEHLGRAQRTAGQILRFGFLGDNPERPNGGNNRQQLELELGDVMAAVELMGRSTDVSMPVILDRVNVTLQQISAFTYHQPDYIFASER
jgi:NTP pyrophosphatase (non-canonical NTP hydrolase)